jgi:protein-tyrosine phosphatase
LPIADRGVPAPDADIYDVLRKIDSELRQGKNVVVHCRQSVGRAGLVTAALLVERGLDPEEAIRRVSVARGAPIPETIEQRLWIDAFAAALAPGSSAAS